jgi:hypothetical protein
MLLIAPRHPDIRRRSPAFTPAAVTEMICDGERCRHFRQKHRDGVLFLERARIVQCRSAEPVVFQHQRRPDGGHECEQQRDPEEVCGHT